LGLEVSGEKIVSYFLCQKHSFSEGISDSARADIQDWRREDEFVQANS